VQLNSQQVGQKIDVLRANTQVATAQQQLTAAQNNLGIARQVFNNLVGRPVDTPVSVDDIVGVTVGESITSSEQVGAPSPNIQLYEAPHDDINAIDLNSEITKAYDRRPEVLAARLQVRVEETGVTLARSDLEPTLTLAAAGNYYPTTNFSDPRQRTASISATLTVPFYDGGETHDKVDAARVGVTSAKATVDSRKQDVALDVGEAYLNLITAASQIDAANSALQQAIGARQLAQIRYEGQVGLYLEVTDAESALVSAENNQVNAVYDYFVAKAQYDNAIGQPDVPSGALYPTTPPTH
jgi:outer membrane protein TolC